MGIRIQKSNVAGLPRTAHPAFGLSRMLARQGVLPPCGPLSFAHWFLDTRKDLQSRFETFPFDQSKHSAAWKADPTHARPDVAFMFPISIHKHTISASPPLAKKLAIATFYESRRCGFTPARFSLGRQGIAVAAETFSGVDSHC